MGRLFHGLQSSHGGGTPTIAIASINALMYAGISIVVFVGAWTLGSMGMIAGK
jgi:hypothetical protein